MEKIWRPQSISSKLDRSDKLKKQDYSKKLKSCHVASFALSRELRCLMTIFTFKMLSGANLIIEIQP